MQWTPRQFATVLVQKIERQTRAASRWPRVLLAKPVEPAAECRVVDRHLAIGLRTCVGAMGV